ncbi:GPI mannosyltransferase 1, putative [Eimeria maxima]|uniref:GPI mannosyltransferase 1 n=1 Tax=Eimeria maxima TaxID=5804 RepID=U6MAF7_EIMMA|nr:GPI mannosyltransferase 1, putative [Eimeria maxima]CDJ59484.1 GPI mannosyltransferase 1, putative [Eimeria maxima]
MDIFKFMIYVSIYLMLSLPVAGALDDIQGRPAATATTTATTAAAEANLWEGMRGPWKGCKRQQQRLPPQQYKENRKHGQQRRVPLAYVFASVLLLAVSPGCGYRQRTGYGLAVHLKVYPVIYGVPILLFMQQGALSSPCRVVVAVPSVLLLTAEDGAKAVGLRFIGAETKGCMDVPLTSRTSGLSRANRYGFPFVFESYLYHATRSDHRHNMSPYFYLLYLDSVAPVKKAFSILLAAPSQSRLNVRFSVFPQVPGSSIGHSLRTVAFVALNKVCTTQYFLWWLCLMPFAVGATDMKKNTLLQTGLVMAVFQVACLVWLFFGYQLEFEGKPVFLEVWEPFDL